MNPQRLAVLAIFFEAYCFASLTAQEPNLDGFSTLANLISNSESSEESSQGTGGETNNSDTKRELSFFPIPSSEVRIVPGSTLAELEALALASHPRISVAQADLEAARGQYVQAGLPYNPTLQYQSDEIGNEDSTGLHTLTLSQRFVTGNKLTIAQQEQQRSIQKQCAELRLAQLKVSTRVRQAFAETLVAQQRCELAHTIASLADQAVASVTALLEAEEVSRLALLQSRVEAQQTKITAETADATLAMARKKLAAAVGTAQLPTERVTGDLGNSLEERPWETTLTEIISISPQLQRANAEIQQRTWALRLACARVIPDVTGQVGVGVDTSTDDTFAMVGVSVPLPIRNRNQGNIRTARAKITSASAALSQAQLELQAKLADAVQRYETARVTYKRLTGEVLSDAEETYKLAVEAFEAGETSFLQLLTTQRTLFDTRLRSLESLKQAANAAAEIDTALVTISI